MIDYEEVMNFFLEETRKLEEAYTEVDDLLDRIVIFNGYVKRLPNTKEIKARN